MIDILSMNVKELSEILESIGEAKYRAKQIFDWLHVKMVTDFSSMTNLSKSLREKLSEKCCIYHCEAVEVLKSSDGSMKYLFKLHDGCVIESVLMVYDYGRTVCISSQVGCNMGCTFCASAIGGKERNLTAGEMLSQIYQIQNDCGERISGVVIMGSGEPLDNYENTLKFISLINDENGLNIGQRHITISTCGIVEKIYSLAEENLQITLAISLHAPNDKIRNKTMPISKKYSIDEILKSCKYYAGKTKRRITFEYALIDGVNDSIECAKELADRLHGMLCHVNLIPVNEVKENNYRRSSDENVKAFSDYLNLRSIETTVRRRLGSDINASCGQLRKRYIENIKQEGV